MSDGHPIYVEMRRRGADTWRLNVYRARACGFVSGDIPEDGHAMIATLPFSQVKQTPDSLCISIRHKLVHFCSAGAKKKQHSHLRGKSSGPPLPPQCPPMFLVLQQSPARYWHFTSKDAPPSDVLCVPLIYFLGWIIWFSPTCAAFKHNEHPHLPASLGGITLMKKIRRKAC